MADESVDVNGVGSFRERVSWPLAGRHWAAIGAPGAQTGEEHARRRRSQGDSTLRIAASS